MRVHGSGRISFSRHYNFDDMEMTCIELFDKPSAVFVVIYRPPGTEVRMWYELKDNLESVTDAFHDLNMYNT